jgi:nicotinate-nucleotide pyrophosphorylase (carboxylating)
MVLIKNNHIDAHPKGLRGALAAVVANKPLYMPWEVEVRTLDELRVALEYKPTIIMLDNFADATIVEAVKMIRTLPEPPMIEVSGGITRDRLAKIRLAGADAVSVGALTTQAPNVDISMRISS